MVEYFGALDAVFGCLSDPTRRAILRQVGSGELSVGQIAEKYRMSFAAVSKHLKILENAKLIIKRRQGKHQFVRLCPGTVRPASDYLLSYQKMWESRLDSLEEYLANEALVQTAKPRDVHVRKKAKK